MNALRKFYHRAVQITLDNVERLWQELEAFETNLNWIASKKNMQARTVPYQLVNYAGANLSILPIHPNLFYRFFLSSTHRSLI
jgi:hypothetical protein